MKIEFDCECGQHLRARVESAGRLTLCPRCGEPIAVPTLAPTHRGVAAVDSPATPRLVTSAPERDATEHRGGAMSIALHDGNRPATAGDPQIQVVRKSRLKRLYGPTRPRRDVPFEFNIEAMGLLGIVGAGLAIGSGLALGMWTQVQQAVGQGAWVALAFSVVLLCVCAAYGCSILGQVMHHASRGRQLTADRLRRDPKSAITALGQWLGSFVAGPVVPAVAGVIYWLNCGNVEILDAIILIELSFLSVLYWVFSLLVVLTGGRLTLVSPGRVLREISIMRRRGWAVVLFGCGLVGGLAALAFHAATELHANMAGGILLFSIFWFGGLFVGNIALRVFGRWWFESHQHPLRPHAPAAVPPA